MFDSLRVQCVSFDSWGCEVSDPLDSEGEECIFPKRPWPVNIIYFQIRCAGSADTILKILVACQWHKKECTSLTHLYYALP